MKPPAARPDREVAGGSALGWLLLLAVVFALREARTLLAPVAIGIVLTFVLAPPVRRLVGLGVPKTLASALVVLALVGSTVPLAASVATPAAAWLEQVPTAVAQALAQLDRLRAALQVPGPPAPVRGGRVAPPPAPGPDLIKEKLASEGVALTGLLLGRSASFVFSATATLLLLFFFLASEQWIVARCVEATPHRRTRALLLGGVRSAQREIGRFLATQGLINVVAGILTGLVLWTQGLPNPTLWAALVAVLCFVPYLGPLAITLLLLAAGMSSFPGLGQMLGPALAFGVIHGVESNLISPWLVGRRLALSPISVFLSVLFWAWLWGIAGALIAVPMLIAMRTVCRRVPRLRPLGHFLEGERRAAPSMRSLLRQGKPRGASASLPG